ncbi:hypothetical protein WDB88_17230 (plasmid) [Thioclava sp. GXIMD4216]
MTRIADQLSDIQEQILDFGQKDKSAFKPLKMPENTQIYGTFSQDLIVALRLYFARNLSPRRSIAQYVLGSLLMDLKNSARIRRFYF